MTARSGQPDALVTLRCDGPATRLLSLHASFPDRYPFLLRSVSRGADSSRFDILFAYPQETLSLDQLGRLQSPPSVRDGPGFLATLNAWFQQTLVPRPAATALPFRGGWFLYLGYELAAEIEPRLRLPRHDRTYPLPVAAATRVPCAVIYDHGDGATWLIAESAYANCLDSMAADLSETGPEIACPDSGGPAFNVEADDPQLFIDGVKRIKDYVTAGDVFQVNLSRQWRATSEQSVDAAMLFACLCRANPAPFAGIARYGAAAIMSSSPERLVRVQGPIVDTRPIAGTHRRDANGATDAELAQSLLRHPKEKAEHIMLIDLERNDLGRICRPGSVKVNEFMVLESYQHVHHIVSNVRGELNSGVLPGDVIAAVFPGGTITGCPKVRCMEIIAELERTPRGPYTGSFGYLNRDGDMDLNILIRTLLAWENQVVLRAGAGIVADSVPERELAETAAKARGLLRALGQTDA